MFRADDAFRLEVPRSLAPHADRAAYYRLVELVVHQPLWLVRAVGSAPDAAVLRLRHFLVADAQSALALAERKCWVSNELYVMLFSPAGCPGTIALQRCLALFECDEPDGSMSCWRIETESSTVLDSCLGTQIGEEQHPRLRWKAVR